MKETIVKKKFQNGELILKTGLLAKQANGSVLASMGKTQVLATVTMSKSSTLKSFFPLSVDYIEKFYANGRIPGSYTRREGRPSDLEIHTSRLIDRPLRPLFADGFRNEVQVVLTVLSLDKQHPSDVIAMIAASAALTISNIPLKKPIGGVRVGYKNGEVLINPSYEVIGEADLDLLVAGTDTAITMIEGGAKQLSEEEIVKALEKAHQVIKEIIVLQEELKNQVGQDKCTVELFKYNQELLTQLRNNFFKKLNQALINEDKSQRENDLTAIYKEAEESCVEEDIKSQVGMILHDFKGEIIRQLILEQDKRVDGRGLDDIREIDCRINLLDSSHGSALFTRGQTQSLGVVTIGSKRDQQRVDLTRGNTSKPFMLHYNFPPYSVGEVGRLMGTGRREIGHGMLAERSIEPILPSVEDFDFTIRIVSEILESNGSSSMASICSGSLALMNAGVPIKTHVAGIAMGLIMQDNKYKILTDIQGIEDSLGDMDFKVSGTRKGITGFQLDIKIEGITIEIISNALAKAKLARLFILDKMDQCIDTPSSIKENVPRIEIIKIQVEKIRYLIGMGGKNIKAIVEETGSDIDISDEGEVRVFATNDEVMERTKELIESYIGSPKIGGVYKGKIKKITNFGAFVEVLPGTDGLCHISKFSRKRIENLNDVIKEGEILEVVVDDVDDQGKISLSLVKELEV